MRVRIKETQLVLTYARISAEHPSLVGKCRNVAVHVIYDAHCDIGSENKS